MGKKELFPNMSQEIKVVTFISNLNKQIQKVIINQTLLPTYEEAIKNAKIIEDNLVVINKITDTSKRVVNSIKKELLLAIKNIKLTIL